MFVPDEGAFVRRRRIEVVPRVNARPQRFILRRAGFLRAPPRTGGDRMAIKLALLVVFFGIMLAVGVHCRPPRHGCERLRARRPLGGRVADGLCLRHVPTSRRSSSSATRASSAGASAWPPRGSALGNAFLGSLLAWVVLGRRTRLMSQHPGQRHHAGVLRQALRLQGAEDRRLDHRLYLPSSPTRPRSTTAFPGCSAWPSTSTTRSASSSWRR